MRNRQVAVVGDYKPKNHTHQAADAGLTYAHIEYEWVPTTEVDVDRPAERLERYAGLFIAPSSPYPSMEGSLAAIRYAGERAVRLVGT